MTTLRNKTSGNRRLVRVTVRWIRGRFDALVRAGEVGTVLTFRRRR